MRLSVLLALLTSGVAPAAVAQVTRLPEAVARFGQERAATSLLVRGTTDVPLFAPLLTAFAETVPELSIVYEQWASNDLSHLAEAACRGEIDPPDLIISSAVDQQVKLVNDGCAEPHRSVATAALPREANWRDELFGVTEEPAVIIYNRDLVPPGEEPRSRFDLLDLLRRPNSPYVGRVATYDIESSGLGYLFAFANSQQATTFGSLIEAFGRSGAIATCCSVEIINGVAEGLYLAAYNVLGSYALDRAEEDLRIAVVAPEDYTLVLSRAAMIPRGAENATAAGLLIDFMLSPTGHAALAAQHLLFREDQGVLPGALPDAGASLYRPIPLAPALLLGLDQQKRETFLARWRSTFPR